MVAPTGDITSSAISLARAVGRGRQRVRWVDLQYGRIVGPIQERRWRGRWGDIRRWVWLGQGRRERRSGIRVLTPVNELLEVRLGALWVQSIDRPVPQTIPDRVLHLLERVLAG